jgi:hypothetical protein
MLRLYGSSGFGNIEGWCDAGLFPIMDLLDSLSFNKRGGIAEIGVHHGKFYLMLNSLTQKEDRSYAIDVFDRQDLNIDGSGLGSLENFKKNLELYDAHKGENTTIVHGDSTDTATIGNLLEAAGRGSLRFVSIDGGHTVKHTVSDLDLANALTSNAGVVILDDILNYHWLGVIEGVFKYLQREPTLMPFAIGYNKLFLCKLSFHGQYLNALQQSHRHGKLVSFMGASIVAL